MKVQSVQPTPNPNALKFVLDGRLVDRGSRNFATPAEGANDPLAHSLFELPGVEGIYFCDNFVTVTMAGSADWRAVNDKVVAILDGFERVSTEAEGTSEAASSGSADGAKGDTATDAVLGQINALLDDRVRPALAGDGGGLQVLGLEGKTLTIRYEGACGSCPSSIQGTLMAIQSLLQSEVDAELSVVPG